MIRTLRHSTTVRIKRKRKIQAEIRARDGLSGTAASSSSGHLNIAETNIARSGAGVEKSMTEEEKEKAEEDQDVLRGLHESLHTIGLQVGGNIAEKFVLTGVLQIRCRKS